MQRIFFINARSLLRYAIAIYLIFFSYGVLATNSTLLVKNEVPPGFEDLTGPQINSVDIYLHNRYIASGLATYDLETITFNTPENFIDLLTNLLDPEAILAELKKPLDNHTEKVCLNHSQNNDCGTLKPNVIGVIFDESRFRVDIFINPLQLKTIHLEQTKYLPAADNKFSTIHAIGVNVSGTENSDDNYNLQSTSLVSYGSSRLKLESNYTDTEDFVIDEASLQKDDHGWEAEGGYFSTRTSTTNFIAEKDILGVRVATSTKTRTDLDFSGGTPIFVFLNQRSRVEVFKDDRLIDARFYDAGNRQLDTSRFPDGNYQISVRIREETGGIRREEYFYARNSSLPDINEPQFYVEAGKINETTQDSTLPDTTDEYIVHAGASIRLKESLALEAEIANSNKESLVQVGFTHLAAGTRTNINVMMSTENDWGVSLKENWSTKPFNLNLDLRYIEEGDDNQNDDRFDFITNDEMQVTASLSHQFLDGHVYWQYRHLDRNDVDKSETISLRYQRPIFRTSKYSMDWEFDASKDSDEYIVGTKLNFHFRNKNNIYRVSPGYRNQKENNSKNDEFIGSASWQNSHRTKHLGLLRTRLRHDEENALSSTALELESESEYGTNEIEFINTRQSNENVFGYSVRSQFSLASDFNNFSLGGARNNSSALIVDLPGSPDGEEFEVYVDDQSAGYAKVGSKTVIPLPPYNSYEVFLKPRGSSFVEYDQSIQQITLYPGNVITRTWNVEKVLIYIGQIVDDNGTPVKYARFEDLTTYGGTDDRGWFQIESKEISSLVVTKKDGNKCKIELERQNKDKDVQVFKKLNCKNLVVEKNDHSPTLEQASAHLF